MVKKEDTLKNTKIYLPKFPKKEDIWEDKWSKRRTNGQIPEVKKGVKGGQMVKKV